MSSSAPSLLAVLGGLTVPPELDNEPLVEDEVVLAGPPRLGGRRLRVKDLERESWISREEGSATRAAVEAARWQIGLRAVRALELPSWEAVKLTVAAGAGITAISRFALDATGDEGYSPSSTCPAGASPALSRSCPRETFHSRHPRRASTSCCSTRSGRRSTKPPRGVHQYDLAANQG